MVAVDDLDRLVDTCPEAADHIAELTQYGGPLGVHVIATTGGGALGAVAGAEIRIALRTDDQQSSRALIDVDDAAALGERWVGRGLVRGADGAVVPFQGGRITGRMPRTATLRPTVVRQEWTDMGDALARRTTGAAVRNSSQAANGPTDLALLTGAVRRAAEQSGVTAPAKLWEWDAALR